MHEDDAISRHFDSMHGDEPDALDGPDSCECGEPLRFDDDSECGECRELRLADESAEHAIDDDRERTEAA